jgi:hypothetical protein
VSISRSSSADPTVIEDMIDHHYVTLRRHARYKQCVIRVFIEANLSQIDAKRISNQLEHGRYGSIDIVHEKGSMPGVWTSAPKKEASVFYNPLAHPVHPATRTHPLPVLSCVCVF